MNDARQAQEGLIQHLRGLSMRRVALAIVLLAIGVAAIAAPALVAAYTGQAYLNARGESLIDESLDQNQTTFLAVSGVKAGLAILEGSTVGVGVEVQVGDLIQPAYDYVDFFWNIFLYSLVVLGAYKILLDTGLLELGIVVFGIGAILYAVGLLTPPRERTTPAVGRRCMLLGLLLAYVAPAALMLTHTVSERYTAEVKQVHYESIEEFHAEIEEAQKQFLDLRQRISVLAPGESLEQIRTSIVRIAGTIGESFRLSLLSFLYYSLLVVFDLLFFPFASAWLLYKMAQVALDRTLQPASINGDAPEIQRSEETAQ